MAKVAHTSRAKTHVVGSFVLADKMYMFFSHVPCSGLAAKATISNVARLPMSDMGIEATCSGNYTIVIWCCIPKEALAAMLISSVTDLQAIILKFELLPICRGTSVASITFRSGMNLPIRLLAIETCF
jgi:hypothetical protein